MKNIIEFSHETLSAMSISRHEVVLIFNAKSVECFGDISLIKGGVTQRFGEPICMCAGDLVTFLDKAILKMEHRNRYRVPF